MRKKQQTRDSQKGAHLLKVCLVGSSQDIVDNIFLKNRKKKTHEHWFEKGWDGIDLSIGFRISLYPVKVEDELCKIQLWHFTRTVNDPNSLKNFYDGAYSLIYVVDTSEIDALKKIRSHYEEYLTILPKLRVNPTSNPDYPYVLLSISPDPNSLDNRKAGDYAQSIKAHFIQIQEENEKIIVEILKFLASNYLEYFKKIVIS